MTLTAPTSPPPAATTDLPVRSVIDALLARFGAEHQARIERGVRQVARRWQQSDGSGADFEAFCLRHFVADEGDLRRLFNRFEVAVEQIGGHLHEMRRTLRRWSDLRGDDLPGVDDLLAKFDPAPDLSDQLYRQRLAFVVLLNFARPELPEMLERGGEWKTEQWAEARIAQAFGARVPSELNDLARRISHEANVFVQEFHVPVGGMVDGSGRQWFEPGRRLIAHWLIREQIKAAYGREHGAELQRALAWVMARHIDGSIPRSVMDGTATGKWDPQANTINGQPVNSSSSRTAQGSPSPGDVDAVVGPERYRRWLDQRSLAERFDRLYPEHPTAMARKFDLHREVPETEVERLLIELLEAPMRRDLAALLARRIGRPLEAFDIYFEDLAEECDGPSMDAAVRTHFADEGDFQSKLPQILRGLGFASEDADFLGSRIRVEIAKGAGHAIRPLLTEYDAWLRTNRLDKELGWDGFDTAMHELGHNLEQLISTFFVPRSSLRGVPNTACTEAFAFLYQSLGRRVLGLEDPALAQRQADLDAVQTMLAACQIAGPSLLELHAWRWLYAHPGASPEALRDEVISIADRLWSRFYERDFGPDPYHLLAAYQHMIAHPLYLADYTLGHIMSHQIRSHMHGKDLAAETKRICSIGRVTPDLWMRRAVGSPVSAAALIRDSAEALARLT
ncbi:MAG: hypothetical protein KF724_07555 [Phycisphaeraceae bacterium]|nr:hypothetical protein [Phycisphaeraceae bacterium]